MLFKISLACRYDYGVLASDYMFLWLQNVAKLHAKGIGTISGKLLVGTAESIPQTELVDTTGAGDAFIGAVLYCMYLSNIIYFGVVPFTVIPWPSYTLSEIL